MFEEYKLILFKDSVESFEYIICNRFIFLILSNDY